MYTVLLTPRRAMILSRWGGIRTSEYTPIRTRTTRSEDLLRVEIAGLTRAQHNLCPGLPVQIEHFDLLLQPVDRLDEDEIFSQLVALELALPVLPLWKVAGEHDCG